MHETDGCTFAPQTTKKLIKELRDAPIAARYTKNQLQNISEAEEKNR